MCESGRKEMQASVGLKVEPGDSVVLIGCDVAVGEHDAFGLAGGAGGVDERGQIGGLDGADQGIEDRDRARAGVVGTGKELGECDGAVRQLVPNPS